MVRYLVDVRWMKQWKKYVGYDKRDQSLAGEASAHPGPVENSFLFRSTSKHQERLFIDDVPRLCKFLRSISERSEEHANISEMIITDNSLNQTLSSGIVLPLTNDLMAMNEKELEYFLLLQQSDILKEHLEAELDYFLLPQEAWDKLIAWYGLNSLSSPIPRMVVEYGLYMKHCKVEVYPLKFKLCLHPASTHINIKFSHSNTTGFLESMARTIFDISSDKKSRIWHRYMTSYELLNSGSQTVQDAGLYNGQIVMLEVMNENGTWPRSSNSPARVQAPAQILPKELFLRVKWITGDGERSRPKEVASNHQDLRSEYQESQEKVQLTPPQAEKERKISEDERVLLKQRTDIERKDQLEQIIREKDQRTQVIEVASDHQDLQSKDQEIQAVVQLILSIESRLHKKERKITEDEQVMLNQRTDIERKDQLIQEKEQMIQDKDQMIQDKDQMIQKKDQTIEEKEQELCKSNQEIAENKQAIGDLESNLQEKQQKIAKNEQVMQSQSVQIEALKKEIQELEQARLEFEQHSKEMEQRVQEVELRLSTSDNVFQDLLQRLTGQIPQSQPAWVIQRDEVELTDEELGAGGWASIKVANFRGQRVAAKCLHHQLISAHNIRIFTREMSMAAQARHPNLLQFVGATMDNNPIILTELLPTSLRRIMEEGTRLSRATIKSLSLDVARGLNYLHLTKPDPIVHRDISSANVLLEGHIDRRWKAKLSDYGSVNFVRYTTTAGPGNPLYAAPEANDPKRHSPKMDVYSFGILLVEMCSGELPDKCEELIRTHLHSWPEMVRIVRVCLHQDPQRRASMNDLITQLDGLHVV